MFMDCENLSEEEIDKKVEQLLDNKDYMCWLVSFINQHLQKSLAMLDVASKFILSANYSNPCDYAQGRAIANAIKELLDEEKNFN